MWRMKGEQWCRVRKREGINISILNENAHGIDIEMREQETHWERGKGKERESKPQIQFIQTNRLIEQNTNKSWRKGKSTKV